MDVYIKRNPSDDGAFPPYGVKGKIVTSKGGEQVWVCESEPDLTGYDAFIITESEAVVLSLKHTPGTLLSSEVDNLRQTIINEYGIDIRDETINGMSAEEYLTNYTLSLPESHPYRQEVEIL